ncbi:hypothetical protein E8D34_05175 [Nocardioides sp. GY 10113]|uniref:hypothetical protein n=1 Tax=Nocardioides sp. GY 10113 TaxID=2569761 RepID=UPI0010A8170D|nr:hypothetical protein [Nocardioides sp. GY 10113]TIC88330.1 hypothetical protein E8D34_05175 [Nocardioides sp. GY 10113]
MRRAQASGAPAARRPVRVPGRGLVDGWTLLAAAVVASPAYWQLAQGMVSLTDALTRYLAVLAGCCVASLAIRGTWPVLIGPAGSSAKDTDARETAELLGATGRLESSGADDAALWDAEGDVADLLGAPRS